MQETQVQSLGWEDPLEKEMATHSSILAWRIPWTEMAWQAAVHGVARVGHDLASKPPPSKIPRCSPRFMAPGIIPSTMTIIGFTYMIDII